MALIHVNVLYIYIYIYTYSPAICLNWLDIEIFACNMNEFHIYIYIYIYSPMICMNWLDIEIFACNMHFFFFFGVYTPNPPKAMWRPSSHPLKGLVHPHENGLHKRPAFQAKGMFKEIPLFRRHTLFWSIHTKSMPPPPRPFRLSPFIYSSSTSTPLLALS